MNTVLSPVSWPLCGAPCAALLGPRVNEDGPRPRGGSGGRTQSYDPVVPLRGRRQNQCIHTFLVLVEMVYLCTTCCRIYVSKRITCVLIRLCLDVFRCCQAHTDAQKRRFPSFIYCFHWVLNVLHLFSFLVPVFPVQFCKLIL